MEKWQTLDLGFTCVDTLARSCIKGSCEKAADAANKRENNNTKTSENLENYFGLFLQRYER